MLGLVLRSYKYTGGVISPGVLTVASYWEEKRLFERMTRYSSKGANIRPHFNLFTNTQRDYQLVKRLVLKWIVCFIWHLPSLKKINIFEKSTTCGFVHQTCIVNYNGSEMMTNTIQKIFEICVTSFCVSISQTQYDQAQSTPILHNSDAQLFGAYIISSRGIFMEIREVIHGKNSFFEIFSQ